MFSARSFVAVARSKQQNQNKQNLDFLHLISYYYFKKTWQIYNILQLDRFLTICQKSENMISSDNCEQMY
jgi:hypothetical protein